MRRNAEPTRLMMRRRRHATRHRALAKEGRDARNTRGMPAWPVLEGWTTLQSEVAAAAAVAAAAEASAETGCYILMGTSPRPARRIGARSKRLERAARMEARELGYIVVTEIATGVTDSGYAKGHTGPMRFALREGTMSATVSGHITPIRPSHMGSATGGIGNSAVPPLG